MDKIKQKTPKHEAETVGITVIKGHYFIHIIQY